jgi:hypothetical protein
MSERDQTHDEEAEVVIKAIDATLVFVAAWTLWKSTHDVDSLELNCCEASKVLHITANSLESAMRKLIMNQNFIKRVFGTELAVIVEREAKRILEEQEIRLSRLAKKH